MHPQFQAGPGWGHALDLVTHWTQGGWGQLRHRHNTRQPAAAACCRYESCTRGTHHSHNQPAHAPHPLQHRTAARSSACQHINTPPLAGPWHQQGWQFGSPCCRPNQPWKLLAAW